MEQELKDKLEVLDYVKKYIEHICIIKTTLTPLPFLFKDIMEFVMRATKGHINPKLVADVIEFVGIEKDKEYIVIDRSIHLA
jgi:hypothetical protein